LKDHGVTRPFAVKMYVDVRRHAHCESTLTQNQSN
jgi:hypothetical protein